MGVDDQLRAWTKLTYSPSDPDRLDFTSPDSMDQVMQECLRVAKQHLGSAWLEREFLGPVRHRGAGLGFDNDPDWIGPIPLMRLYSLASELHEARRIPGFDAFAKGLRSRSLTDATAEMWAVRHCTEGGQGAWFVDPLGQPGRSPDAMAILNGMTVAVEVKARAEMPIGAYDRKKILSTLGSARGQLPAEGPSLVYLRLSPPWSEHEETLLSIRDACISFLRNTRRVNAVVLMIERRLPHPEGGGMAFKTATLTIPNERPHVWVPDIQGWLPV